jgi:hypothetical protein
MSGILNLESSDVSESEVRRSNYSARPAFASERLAWDGSDQPVRYSLTRPLPTDQTELTLTPLELLDGLAALMPPPRRHRNHYVTASPHPGSGPPPATAQGSRARALIPWPDQWAFLAGVQRLDAALVYALAGEASRRGLVIGVRMSDVGDEDDRTPWKRPPSAGGKWRCRSMAS